MGRSPGDQRAKGALRKTLTDWLEGRQKDGAGAQAEWKWHAEAKAVFPEHAAQISKHLFHKVFQGLGFPHPLKLKGREREGL